MTTITHIEYDLWIDDGANPGEPDQFVVCVTKRTCHAVGSVEIDGRAWAGDQYPTRGAALLADIEEALAWINQDRPAGLVIPLDPSRPTKCPSTVDLMTIRVEL